MTEIQNEKTLNVSYKAKLRQAGKDERKKTFSVKVPVEIVRDNNLQPKETLFVNISK